MVQAVREIDDVTAGGEGERFSYGDQTLAAII
jgi:hypothetical protein